MDDEKGRQVVCQGTIGPLKAEDQLLVFKRFAEASGQAFSILLPNAGGDSCHDDSPRMHTDGYDGENRYYYRASKYRQVISNSNITIWPQRNLRPFFNCTHCLSLRL